MIPSHSRPRAAARSLRAIFGLAFVASFAAFGGLGMARPDWREALTREDGPIEGLTVGALKL